MMHTYKGYRFESSGRYHAADYLQGEDTMFSYFKEQMQLYPLVKITDNEDYIIAEAKEGAIVFPQHLAILQLREKIREKNGFDSVDFMERLRDIEIDISVPVPQNEAQAEELLNRLFTHYMNNLQ